MQASMLDRDGRSLAALGMTGFRRTGIHRARKSTDSPLHSPDPSGNSSIAITIASSRPSCAG